MAILVIFVVPALTIHVGDLAGKTAAVNPLPTLPTVAMVLGNKKVVLWIARTIGQQEHGLMHIIRMPLNCGMIFVFHHAKIERFWMRHTLIPLDILFITRHGKIVRHYTMLPDHGKRIYSSGKPILYAIELNAGCFRKFGLHNGLILTLPRQLLTSTVAGAIQP